MNKKKKSKNDILLVCKEITKKKKIISHRNYRTTKSKKMQSQNLKLNLKKYCKFCQKTHLHQEQTI